MQSSFPLFVPTEMISLVTTGEMYECGDGVVCVFFVKKVRLFEKKSRLKMDSIQTREKQCLVFSVRLPLKWSRDALLCVVLCCYFDAACMTICLFDKLRWFDVSQAGSLFDCDEVTVHAMPAAGWTGWRVIQVIRRFSSPIFEKQIASCIMCISVFRIKP